MDRARGDHQVKVKPTSRKETAWLLKAQISQ